MRGLVFAVLVAGLHGFGAPASAVPASFSSSATDDEPPSRELAREAMSLLRRRCAGCHQPSRAKGGVDLSSHAAILAGDREGTAVLVPGDPAASPLFQSVIPHDGEEPEMPEDADPLVEEEVELLRAWITAGAPDDGRSGPRYDAEHPPVYERAPVITSLDWSPDGRWIAVSGFHETLVFTTEGEPAARLVGLSERIESVAFSPDGSRLAVAGGSPARFGEVQVWSLEPARLRLSKSVGGDVLFGLSWSPDGLGLAFGATDDALRIVDPRDGEQTLYQGAHEDWVLGTAFSVDGKHLVSVSRDRSMKLVLVPEEQFIDNITSITPGALKGGLQAVDRHPARDELLVGGADGTPRLYRMFREKKRVIGDDFNLLRALPSMPGRVFDVAYSPDGSLCAAVSSTGDAGQVQLAAEKDGAARWSVDWPCGAYALAFSPAGDALVVGGFDGVLRRYAVVDGTLQAEWSALPGPEARAR